MGYATHQSEHGIGTREELLFDGRLLYRGAGTHWPLAGARLLAVLACKET